MYAIKSKFLGSNQMIEVSEQARDELKKLLAEQADRYIRVFFQGFG